MKDLLWFILAIFILGALWAATGGAERAVKENAPFLEQPSPIESGQPYTLEQLRDRTRP